MINPYISLSQALAHFYLDLQTYEGPRAWRIATMRGGLIKLGSLLMILLAGTRALAEQPFTLKEQLNLRKGTGISSLFLPIFFAKNYLAMQSAILILNLAFSNFAFAQENLVSAPEEHFSIDVRAAMSGDKQFVLPAGATIKPVVLGAKDGNNQFQRIFELRNNPPLRKVTKQTTFDEIETGTDIQINGIKLSMDQLGQRYFTYDIPDLIGGSEDYCSATFLSIRADTEGNTMTLETALATAPVSKSNVFRVVQSVKHAPGDGSAPSTFLVLFDHGLHYEFILACHSHVKLSDYGKKSGLKFSILQSK